MFASVLLRFAVIVALGFCSFGAARFDGADEVVQIFRDVVELRLRAEDGLERLKRIPRDVAIPAVVAQLSTQEVGKSGAARSMGFEALAHHGAGSAPEARETLLGCLGERNAAIAAPCAEALPSDVLQAFVAEQALRLRAPGVDEETKHFAIIRLANLTPFVAEAFAPLPECYADATRSGPERSIAFRGMLWSGRIAECIELARKADPPGHRLALSQAGRYAGESGLKQCLSTAPADVEACNAIRGFVFDGMRHEDAKTRRAALEALRLQFPGETAVIVRSATDYELNPTLRAALERMANEDQDQDLRNSAAKMLDLGRWERTVRKILQARDEANKP